MHLKTRNVNTAFQTLVRMIYTGELPTVENASRYGEVAVVEEPVIVEYMNPIEKVLFNEVRDANPFFHLYEAMWMLAGSNDVAPLVYYNSRMSEFSDDGEIFNGAYGYRWRQHTNRLPGTGKTFRNMKTGEPKIFYPVYDQLDLLVQHLKANPLSRRAVLQMWNVEDDLLKIDTSKDVCCNLSVHFMVRLGPCRTCGGLGYVRKHMDDFASFTCIDCRGQPNDQPSYLDMTVFNRSNDLIWGLLGANAVHFAFLQEYMAGMLNLDVGRYFQVTNNLHVYTAEDRWRPEEWLAEYETPPFNGYGFDDTNGPGIGHYHDGYVPLVAHQDRFDNELARFVEWHSRDAIAGEFYEPFLARVAQPVCIAYHHYKRGQLRDAIRVCESIEAPDWRRACRTWLQRRLEKRNASVKGGVS